MTDKSVRQTLKLLKKKHLKKNFFEPAKKIFDQVISKESRINNACFFDLKNNEKNVNFSKNNLLGGLRTKGIIKHGSKVKPLVSVITVVLNGEKYLEKAILSINKQTYRNLEHIIIDGGSKDGTLEIIKKHENIIDFWISEKDNGIYNAMNKGIALSKGDYVGFVGSDDYLYPNTLEKFTREAKKRPIDYTVGPVDIINDNEQIIEKILVLPNFLYKDRFIFDMATHHLSFYVSRRILDKVGNFDEAFNIRSDYDMTINVISASRNNFDFVDSVGGFRKGGISGSYHSYFESYNILRKHKISVLKSILNILPLLIKVFIIKNFPSSIVNFLRKNFSSGRFIR
jgi:glycosyltransferase involved in cell wall biosynthesis